MTRALLFAVIAALAVALTAAAIPHEPAGSPYGYVKFWPKDRTDAGGATPAGPRLEVSGRLVGGGVLWAEVWGLPPNTPATLYLGPPKPTPKNGGIFWPKISVALPVTTTAKIVDSWNGKVIAQGGGLGVPLVLPATVPTTGVLAAQCWAKVGGYWKGTNAVLLDFGKAVQ